MRKGNVWLQWLSWLQVQYKNCIVCGKTISQASSVQNVNGIHHPKLLSANMKLCVHCQAQIMWIDKVLCMHCGRRERCPDCGKYESSALWLNRSAVRYKAEMKEWLHRFKFQGDECLAELMGTMLLPAVERVSLQMIIRQGILQQYKQYKQRRGNKTPAAWLRSMSGVAWDAITAVPLSAERYRERGFNQAELLAKFVSKQTSIPYYDLLLRPEHSTRMSHQNRQARMENIANRYVCSTKELNRLLRDTVSEEVLRPLYILIVDDVYTTGGTVHACANVLTQACPVPLIVASVTWARS